MPDNSKIAVTWIEVILVLLLATIGMGIWIASAHLVEGLLVLREPEPGEIEIHYHMAALRRDQAATEEEWKATLGLRIQQKLEIERLSSQIAALEQTFPGLRSKEPAVDSIPAGTIDSYRNAHQQKLAATLLEQRLTKRLHHLAATQVRREWMLREASRAVSDKLESIRAGLAWRRRIWMAVLRGGGLAALLLAASALLAQPTLGRTGAHRGPVLAAAALLLLILILYELLGTAFAASFGGLLLLAGLWMLLRSVPVRTPDGR